VQAHAGDARDDEVGDLRRDLARQRLVLPVLAPAGDDVDVGLVLEELEQPGNVGGVVLQASNPACSAADWP